MKCKTAVDIRIGRKTFAFRGQICSQNSIPKFPTLAVWSYAVIRDHSVNIGVISSATEPYHLILLQLFSFQGQNLHLSLIKSNTKILMVARFSN